MKVTTSILIMYFCVLMVQPFVNMELRLSNKPNSCHPQEMCCKEKMKHQGHKDQNTTCNRDFCNPFVPCGTSITYSYRVHCFENNVLELAKKMKPAINDAIISNYLSDCWHPPKLS